MNVMLQNLFLMLLGFLAACKKNLANILGYKLCEKFKKST